MTHGTWDSDQGERQQTGEKKQTWNIISGRVKGYEDKIRQAAILDWAAREGH